MNIHKSGWIDISVPLDASTPHWPGDPAVELHSEEHGSFRTTTLRLSSHSGTHIDAPRHFFPEGAAIEAMPPDAAVGPVRVMDAAACEEARLPARPERILIKTGGSRQGIPMPFALALAAAGVRLVGIDSMSVDRYDSEDFPVHKVLLQQGVWILESLDLSAVREGDYELLCLPLRIPGADAAPARAFLRLPDRAG
jgi:arylformamidase